MIFVQGSLLLYGSWIENTGNKSKGEWLSTLCLSTTDRYLTIKKVTVDLKGLL